MVRLDRTVTFDIVLMRMVRSSRLMVRALLSYQSPFHRHDPARPGHVLLLVNTVKDVSERKSSMSPVKATRRAISNSKFPVLCIFSDEVSLSMLGCIRA